MRTKSELENALDYLKMVDKNDRAAGTTRRAWAIAIECIEKELRLYRGCSDVKEFYEDDEELDAPGFQWVSKREKAAE